MPNFYVNKHAQANGDHEVHEDATMPCPKAPLAANRDPLGWHADCRGAVTAATAKGYRKADGCYYCARPCHTS